MALADPITINSVSCPRISTNGTASVYQSADQAYRVTVSQASGKRNSALVRLDVTKTAADPLISAQNIVYSMSVSAIINRPLTGYTVAEQVANFGHLTTWLAASTNAALTKVAGFEN